MREKILVIHQGALGDVILCFPALRSLKQGTGASVALLCNDQVGKIAHELKIAEAHFPVESARFCSLFSNDMSHEMKGLVSNYDTIVLMGFSGDTAKGIRQHHKGQTYRITPRPPAEAETHVAIHVIEQLQARGLLTKRKDIASHASQPGESLFGDSTWHRPKSRISNHSPHIQADPSLFDYPAIDQSENKQPRNLLLIHPGAGSKRKRWPLEKFVEVAAALRGRNSKDVVFLVGPAEADLLPLIRNQTQDRFHVQQVEDLSEVTAFMKASRCFVGNDSGLTHLVAYVGLPTVAIFGPSSPKRWSPIGRATKVLRGEADCTPCFEIANQNCDDPQCLSRVSVEMVLEAVEDVGAA